VIYRVESPTRVDLAGGTLDCWPLYLFTHGACTINVAIDIWTKAELQPLAEPTIHWISKDLNLDKTFADKNECLNSKDPEALWLQILVRSFNPSHGFRLMTSSDSPVGGGIGGSSSLFVSCYKAFRYWLPEPPLGVVEHVRKVSHLEAEMIHSPPGTQDYYPAFRGGINVIDYHWDRIDHQTLPVQNTPLMDHFFLVYTGRSHHSGINNFDVLTRAVKKDSRTLGALFEVKQVALELREALMASDWSKMPNLFVREYQARLHLSETFASPEIHALNKLCLKEGASAVKICGAGGGGCVMVWVSPDLKAKVSQSCQKEGFTVLEAKPIEAFQV